jgi:hypothetical protein
MAQLFKLPKNASRERQLQRINAFLLSLSTGRAWSIEVKELRPKRSDAQNRYLWGICYPAIMKHLEGWEAQDVHDYCLGECFGWEKIEGLGRARLRPLKRSSGLSVTEFMDYVDWIQRNMAQKGIYVPAPNEETA